MGFVSSLLGFANKNKFVNNSGLVGKIAQGVSKAANLVSTIVPKAVPIVNKVMTVANLAYKSGLADKLTGGKATRFVKGVQNMFGGNKGVTQNNAANKLVLLQVVLKWLRLCSIFNNLYFYLNESI